MTFYEYDGSGRLTSTVDANGNTTICAYDLAGRLIAETNALGHTTNYTHDAVGNRISLADANGNATTFDYDSANRLVTTTYPDGTFEQRTYEAAGRTTSETDRMGRSTTFSYDALGRLVNKAYLDASTATFAYDAVDHMTSASNDAVALSFTYDSLGRLLSESNDTWGTSVTYTYDASGHRMTMTGPEEQLTTYSYDAADRLTQIAHAVIGTVIYTYDASGRRVGTALPNGTTVTYAYDGAAHLLNIDHRRSDGSPLLSLAYALDALGNRTSMTDDQGVHNYSYDAVYQLTAATHPDPTVNPNETYTYDPVGNRLTSHLSTGYTYDNNNRLLEDDDFTYEYEPNGNQARRTTKVSGAVRQYVYDFNNRLIGVALQDGTVATYYYGPLGRRIEKTVNGTSIRFAYALEDILSEYDDSGALLISYVHGPAIDEPVAMLHSGLTYLFHADALQSIRVLTDSAEAIVAAYTYGSFGQVVGDSGSVANRYRYTGREWDTELSLYYYRARVLSPLSGRFLQADPTGFEAGVNFYVYASNSPVNLIDPSGLYGTNDCSYYEKRCFESGGKYYCDTAPKWCDRFPKYPDPLPGEDADFEGWARCTRQCLQDCDRTANKNQNYCPAAPDPKTDSFWDRLHFNCHVKCYTKCGAWGTGDFLIPPAW